MVPAMLLFMLCWTTAANAANAATLANSTDGLLFNKFKIYGSKQTLMGSGFTQCTPYNRIRVTVDNMYNTDGSSSSYKTSLWSVTAVYSGLICVDNIPVNKGTATPIKISNNESPGVKYGVNVNGNNPKKDALISGIVGNFSKR